MKTPQVRRRGIVRLLAVAGRVLAVPGLSSADQPLLKAACDAMRETDTHNGDLVLTTLDKAGATVYPYMPTKQYDVLVGWYERQVHRGVWTVQGILRHELRNAACQLTAR